MILALSLAWQHVWIGVALALVACVYCFLCGSVLRTPRLAPDWDPGAFDEGTALLDVVLTTVCGIALVGFATFALGELGAIYPVTLVFLLLAAGVACALLGDNPVRRAFWTRRANLVRRAFGPGALLVLAAAVAMAAPAAIPDGGSDATIYHHAYAYDWAVAHRVYTDWWLRAPFYANNWLLIVAWAYELGGLDYVLFTTWLTGMLSLLCVYAFVVRAVPAHTVARRVAASALGIAATAGWAASPLFLEFAVQSYIDIPIGLFFLAFAAAVTLSASTRARWPISDAIVIGGFFVGMKISLIVFLPLVAVCVAYCARAARLGAARGFVAIALAVVASSPWYLRNFILAGDPISPVLNMALLGKDPAYSKTDYTVGMGAIAAGNSPRDLFVLPWQAFTDPQSLFGVGVPVEFLLIWLPAAVLAVAIMRRRATGLVPVTAALLVYAYAYWTATSDFIRYATVFLPLLAAFVGAVAATLVFRSRRAPVAAVVACAVLLVLAIPAPASAPFFHFAWYDEYKTLSVVYPDRKKSLENRSPGYHEVEYVTYVFQHAHRPDLRVYRLNLESQTLFYKLAGVDAIGEWWGPERYADFRNAVDLNDMRNYLARFRIGAVVLPLAESGSVLTQDDYDILDHELRVLHWRRVQIPKTGYLMYFSPELGPLPPVSRFAP